MRAPAAGFAALLSSCPALISRSRSPAPLSSYPKSPTYSSPLSALLEIPTVLYFHLVLTPVFGSLVVLLFLPMLGQIPPHLASIAFRTFKRALSDEFLHCSTRPAELLCPFPPLGL